MAQIPLGQNTNTRQLLNPKSSISNATSSDEDVNKWIKRETIGENRDYIYEKGRIPYFNTPL